MTTLAEQLPTFGQYLLNRYGERVHKIALDAAFTCPNRDGSKGIGGCTFCNNVSFSPNGRRPKPIGEQIESGRRVIRRRTGATKYLGYFQAYTNTYDDIQRLAQLYGSALAEKDIVGLSIGTRPDCVPDAVLDLLADYQAAGYEIWLELGLQSAFDETLARVNRGHGFAAYADAVSRARSRGLKTCTHMIAGLPGETARHCHETLQRVLELGTDGLKLHPLHVVKGTELANTWRRGEYRPLTLEAYVNIAADLVARTPPNIVWHRLTGTAPKTILLAPNWCTQKWRVLNAIANELQQRRESRRQVA
ncbi:MAG: TIGR01212 family radical SAM protein [Candidatus Thiodiazotropha sp. (ex Dulcina madagascariensis)]|nr:TIGR01212 family radical SAM protein [Candidatus Thiodiazotropha sp. (ex Epidulcina cf. delphinae)]MCU7924219.1 TIGR01212 family radical SAM protein [Candidatus Thiodiazotropha sp. (ex Dulcina madagascariensis)]MCU7927761.1 TIGR01212 family radical SAM protein [Candidatus Thiodiazotropha sp. (ex Dulcina madagascariensis)]MCU7936987.1 TIGR01212 family radical SAM protein [Candidatus Thiodiazotropha sp. (ex Dulcina madagascariensis)]